MFSSLMRKMVLGLIVSAAAAASRTAAADTCTYISTGNQGDSFLMSGTNGWKCQQKFIDYWWDAFDFDHDDWDNGFGYDDPCNNVQPLARTFNALFALGYSSTGSPDCNSSASNVTHWAMCWAADNIDEVDGRCGNGTTSGTLATTFSGAFVNDRTEFYWPFFYGSDAARRASTVFHESRHAWGCGHNGGSGCPRGGSCDSSWSNGCSGSGSAGANRFQVSFLSWYANTAWRTTNALRTSAVARGNDVLANGYNNDPCFRLSSNGTTFSSC